MYHYVHDSEPLLPGNIGGLSRHDFVRQIDRLCQELEPTDWPSLYAWMQGRGSIPPRSFLLTFDDALADHARNVLPILNERGLRGVFFVPGSVLTSHQLLSAHAVHMLLASVGDEQLLRELEAHVRSRTEGSTLLDKLDTVAAAAMYAYESPRRARIKYLVTMVLPPDLRDEAVTALFERHVGSPVRWARRWYLGWDDLVAMQSSGHAVGGHGFSHEPYLRLAPARRRQDAGHVAAILNDGLGPDIRPFSFPYGSFDDDSCAACAAAGFAHCFTTESTWITPDCNVMCLPRVDTIHIAAALKEEPSCANT